MGDYEIVVKSGMITLDQCPGHYIPIGLNEEKPWWWYRCTHREHAYDVYDDGSEYGCWRVLREAEQVAILHLTCLHVVHICVNWQNNSSCRVLPRSTFVKMEEPHILALVAELLNDLRAIT